ncbi:MAG: tail fiber domain-containing protein [Chitinophagaceae bacterium]
MKKILPCIITFQFLSTILLAQSVGINNNAPHASAILDVQSSTKGFLMPRMTTLQRNAIASPAAGLKVYDTDTNIFWFYNGTAWLPIAAGNLGWNLTGNTGTNPATHFIGTTDEQPLRFRVNNLWAGALHPTSGNIFLGVGAGQTNTAGQANTAIGEYALFRNTDGNFNVASGYYALTANTNGYNNTAHGAYALYNNTLGFSNTAIGRNALFGNINGAFNTAVGTDALLTNTGSYNTANGYKAAYFNATGSFNTATGSWALYSNIGGLFNTANGYLALNHNLNGLSNTASGKEALFYNNEGSNNTAMGSDALHNNSTGNFNTANGNNALYNNNTGRDNTGIGNNALANNFAGNFNASIGSSALMNNQNGSNNTAIGSFALSSNTNGSNNTALGYAADVNTLVFNSTAIGNGAIINTSNKVRIGNSSVTVIEGQVAYSFPSDARFKYNIKENVPGLDFIIRLTPVTYYFDNQKLDSYTKTGILDNSISVYEPGNSEISLRTGFLAQDVEKVASELGYEFDGIHIPVNDKDHYSLAYSQFVMPIVKAMQEQQVMIETLKNKLELQEKRLATLETKKKIEQLKKFIIKK